MYVKEIMQFVQEMMWKNTHKAYLRLKTGCVSFPSCCIINFVPKAEFDT